MEDHEKNEFDVANWEEFEKRLKDLQEKHRQREGSPGPRPSPLLFRGQENSCWPLNTTLERSRREGMLFTDYYRLVSVVRPEIEASMGIKFGDVAVDLENDFFLDQGFFVLNLRAGKLPGSDCWVYLRHHGFPSPLLDWTRSHEIAAYFAFRRTTNSAEKASIYVLLDSPEGLKSDSTGQPFIKRPSVDYRHVKRHVSQQSDYTICMVWDNSNKQPRFARHDKVYALGKTDQDVLWKFNIPSTERLKVLKSLDNRNINAFSSFESEESLMETLALRELDFKEHDF